MAVRKLYIALVDPGDIFDPNVHNVEDEKMLSVKISQEEGEFATAEIQIENPGQGLLSPSRKKRVFISYDDGINPATLIFSGRVVGFPTNLAARTVNVTYIAQPEDWEVVQDAFIQGLKVAPYYNELFIPEDRRDDAAEVLAARSSLLYWDRATNALSLSDILEGSQIIDIQGRALFNSVDVSVGDTPLKAVNISVECQWEQFGVGEVDVGTAIEGGFTNTVGPNNIVNTLTPHSFEDAWRGVRIPNGYEVLESKLTPTADDFGLVQSDLRSPIITVNASDFPFSGGGTDGTREVSVPRVWYRSDLFLQAIYEQKRREVFSTQVVADTQDFSLRGDLTETISVRLQDPTAAAQSSVFNAKLPSFFYDTDLLTLSALGSEVIEHAILKASSRLKYANRVVEAKLEGDLNELIGITTDHSLRFDDSRIPGGSMRGKVKSYALQIDGDSGQIVAQIILGACIGLGLNSSGSGTEIGLESYDNEYGASPMSSSIFYELTAPPVISEPIDVDLMETDDQYLIDSVVITNDGQTQYNGFQQEDIDPPTNGSGRPDLFLENNPTSVQVDLKSMNPDSELFSQTSITTSNLTLPKHVNMEAV